MKQLKNEKGKDILPTFLLKYIDFINTSKELL